MPRHRKQSQLCKRCAALIRRTSSSGSPFDFLPHYQADSKASASLAIRYTACDFVTVRRAARRRFAYLSDWHAPDKISATPKIVIAHDPRFFSKEFAELAAKVAAETGCDACVFEGPRSVPELSFAVRYLKASSGVVITASHNPPYDNGYNVYFSDGA